MGYERPADSTASGIRRFPPLDRLTKERTLRRRNDVEDT